LNTKHPFEQVLINEAIVHAQQEYPKEAVGFFVNDTYVPLENIAEDPIKNFRVNPEMFIAYYGSIQAVIHSHGDYGHVSKEDMEGQIRSAIPWGVICLKNGAVDKIAFWGDQIDPYPLIGRVFLHGLWDCYGLLRDYFRFKGITLNQYPRDNRWWEHSPSMLEDNVLDAGFTQVDEKHLRKGDVVFMQIGAPVVNHCGVYLGGSLIIHHLYNKLSRREPISNWRNSVSGYYRYTGDK